MNKITSIAYGFITLIILASCGANKRNESAEQSANAFYTALQAGNVDEALNSCSKDAFSTETREQWNQAVSNNLGLLGKLKSFDKKSGWNISTSTETGTQVIVKYDVVYEYGKSEDSLTMIKDDDGVMRILNYHWNLKSARYLDGITESEKITGMYMDAVAEKNYELAYALCGYKAIEITSKEEWVSMLANTSNAAGDMTNYTVDTEKSHCSIAAEGGAGKGNYYDVYVTSNCANGTVHETFTLFQPHYDEGVKVIAHNRE
ncbi:MAG: hypothetical protein H7Y00_04930 [Fimbriimonadaceae bacterium]|nr:hypothetical protein [Chitinophagales bacterium]